MTNKLTLSLSAGLMGGLLLMGAGCFSHSSTSTSSATPSSDMGASSGTTPTPTNGTADMGTSATIPANFPPDVLQYPGASTLAASVGSGTATLAQSTSDAMSQVVTWINQQYQAHQAQFDHVTQIGNSKTYVFENGGNLYTVRLDPAAGTTYITTTKSPKPL